ncbi:hypothetical protein LTR36_003265 [Oleoguttula mirabilis]|uniref:Methyltransferase domain-containing protein n=1 Tax=Oleoguttula mirabilis TaxID=1507867 RepID=A0AAV9JXF1_9PEZI|nr:hypothetical protein LTR36_003265 [Oleoguttula mirabilis]
MAQKHQSNTYTQGHSKFTTATQQARTAKSDADFLLPYIKKTDYILDVGCGPGTITRGLAKHASDGSTLGIDLSPSVIQKAKTLAAEAADIPTQGPGSVTFEEGNVLERLVYPDESFDVVFASQVFGYLVPAPDVPLRALAEIRRVLKPGGIIATRDAAAQHFYPRSLDLDRHWVHNFTRSIYKGEPPKDTTGMMMPALYRKAGFDAGKVQIGMGTKVFSGPDTRKFLAWRAEGQLKEGDPFRQSWLNSGISVEEIDQAMKAIRKWSETEDAWHVLVQCEMLAWK